ncbi:hypothetical protein QFC22_002847 [Naganishia vaughanmartiniae]|uniref:Uncharacterized protein n=1 Tax=Naganishia vaughanmartiniae TaxID=1424756 RepID=A0ACC2XCA7_9TREE|nr:hypothetical protein QFC22_002847 [Naganishia vaughanmartiniae]
MNPGGQIPPAPSHTYHPHQPGMFTHVPQTQQQQLQQPGQPIGQVNPQLQRNVSMQMAQAQSSHQNQPGQDGQAQQYMMNGSVMTPMQKVQSGAMPNMQGMGVTQAGTMPLAQPNQQALRDFEMQQQFQREQQQRQQLHLQQQAQGQQAQIQGQPGPVQDGALMQAHLQQRMALARQMQQQANAQGQQRIIINTAMPSQAADGNNNVNSAISATAPPQRPSLQISQSGSQQQITQQMQASGPGPMPQHGQQRQSVPPPTPQTTNNHSATQTPQLAQLPNLAPGQGQAGQNGQFSVGMTPRHTATSQGPQAAPPPVNGWDGDVMLHLYIHDYLVKRQFTEAAAALRIEAGLGDHIVVPIDCPQGLLYEWWAVFWDVFSTNNGKPQPSPEAIQFMNVQLRQKLTQHQQMGLGRPSQQMAPQMAQLFRQQQQQQQQQNALRPGQQVMGYQQMNGVTGQVMEMTPAARQQLQQQQQLHQQRQQQQMQLQQHQQGNQAQVQMQGQAGQPMRPMTTSNSVAGNPPLPPGSTMVLGPGNQPQVGHQQMQGQPPQQRMVSVNQQAQNAMAQNASRSGGLMVTGLPISRQTSLPVGAEATHPQFLPPGVMSNQMRRSLALSDNLLITDHALQTLSRRSAIGNSPDISAECQCLAPDGRISASEYHSGTSADGCVTCLGPSSTASSSSCTAAECSSPSAAANATNARSTLAAAICTAGPAKPRPAKWGTSALRGSFTKGCNGYAYCRSDIRHYQLSTAGPE